MIDMFGKRFGRLVVTECAGKLKNNSYYWTCKCDCGNTTTVDGRSLRKGLTRSCGCLDREKHRTNPNRKTHGQHGTRLYRIWKAMKNRCYNANSNDYKKWYGCNGITVCDEWRTNFQSFYDWAMANGYNETLTIDRINPYGNYEPENCRWADLKTQAANKRKGRLLSKTQTDTGA